ncbi:hypothetical protein [Pedobacter aquatilis]|uniref:hypothetical protein n=1 Tax=Pedobacter aquatilis TaxID=351343 RepID=UPI00292CD938|nr:hypothetical protein [Pedobacter aquatilis]
MAYEFTPPRFTDIHSVTQNAKQAYCWIFHKTSLRWWTPDEFYDEYHDKDFMSIQMLNFLEDISIRDPRSGISAAFKQVSKLEEKHKEETQNLIDRIEVFNKKVIEYYQEKSKPILRRHNP